MLPAHKRLRASEVKEVLSRGRSAGALLLSMKYVAHKGPLRSAVVVPKSLLKKAVDRNRIRRAMYRALASIDHAGGAQVAFFVRRVPAPPLSPAFRAELQSLFAKITL